MWQNLRACELYLESQGGTGSEINILEGWHIYEVVDKTSVTRLWWFGKGWVGDAKDGTIREERKAKKIHGCPRKHAGSWSGRGRCIIKREVVGYNLHWWTLTGITQEKSRQIYEKEFVAVNKSHIPVHNNDVHPYNHYLMEWKTLLQHAPQWWYKWHFWDTFSLSMLELSHVV